MVTPIRLGSALRASCAPRLIRPQQAYRGFIAGRHLSAQQGYGDGQGDPVASNPQKQPESNKAQESSEHPGPAPPDVGQDKSGGGKSPADASAASGGSRSKEAAETGSSPTGGSVGGGSSGKGDNDGPVATAKGGEGLKGPTGEGTPQPKVMNQSVPGAKPGLTEEQKREVENHNADFDKRHDRSSKAPDDQVNKKFWQGDAGPKRDGTETDWNA